MSFTTVTVTGKYLTPAGAPAVGTVSFTLSAPIMDAAGKVIRTPATITATLDNTGAFSVPLPANDDTGTVPTGTTYEVVEQLSLSGPRAYAVVIPHTAAAGTVDITALAPVANGSITYGVTSVNGLTGAVNLNAAYLSYDVVAVGTGIDPTGATDSTTALQAKINAIPVGGSMFLPSGTYKITAPLTIANPCRIVGAGVRELIGGNGANHGYVETPLVAPYLLGTVIRQDTAATDAIQITGAGIRVDLEEFGITFGAAGLATNTGHGINAQSASVGGGETNRGIWGVNWKNLIVHGHDGNHYAYYMLNPILCTFTHCRWYGGGGFYGYTNSLSLNDGNLALIHPYGVTFLAGTADAYHFDGRVAGIAANGTMNLITAIRPQAIVTAGEAAFFTGASGATNAQYLWYSPNVEYVSLVGADFESPVSAPVSLRDGTNLDPASLTPTSTFATLIPRVHAVNYMVPPTASAPAFDNLDVNTALYFGGQKYQVGARNTGDYIEYEFVLEKGTYRLDYAYNTANSNAQVQLSFDGTNVGSTIEQYAASQARALTSVTGITLAHNKRVKVRVTSTGKNASSSDRFVSFSGLTVTRTGA